MPRYLERLVARAGIAQGGPSAAPRPRAQFESDASDPFENIAAWNAEPVQTAIQPAKPMRRETAADNTPVKPAVFPITESPSTEIRVEEHWTEANATPSPALVATPEPPAPIVREFHQEIEARPQAAMLEREFHSETMRTEATIERETVRIETPRTAPALEAESLDAREVERNILGKLMPALDAWFHSDSPEPRAAAPVQPALVPPSPRAADAGLPAAAEAPQLMIGSIRVEVVPPPTPSVPAPRARASRPAPRPARPITSKAGFGLGQM